MTDASTTKEAAAMLQPERTALVIVDLQERLLPAIAENDRVLRNSVLLLKLADVIGLPVVLTTQYSRGLGSTVPEVLAAAPDVVPLDKVSFGCFGSPEFLARLQGLGGRDQLLVAGIESHICVAQTVLGALARGYTVHVASDAVGSRTGENRAVGLGRMEKAGALLSSTEMAVYELLGRSDGTAFKKMLPLLK
ncbi:MAG TPA: hydrolase [Vicinamibacteria bacterium]|nr:hydrolase [Vicinamibacteria bacterium]